MDTVNEVCVCVDTFYQTSTTPLTCEACPTGSTTDQDITDCCKYGKLVIAIPRY